MPYIPNTDDDRRLMLDRIGLKDMESLFEPIPENLRLKTPLNLPAPLGEMELLCEMENISRRNRSDLLIFAGGGVYDHFVPSAVQNILSRPEFVTAYTPYQAEVAQGTLQVIYEYQTHICRLTGMDVANASMYDGGSAAAEAVLLALAHTKRNRVVVSETVSPMFRDVIKTYLSGHEAEIITLPHRAGHSDLAQLQAAVDDRCAAVLISQPNFFGLVEEADRAAEIVHKAGGLLIMAIDPIAAAVLKTPADSGADIVIGEGQPLGMPLNFGGPLLGFFAVKKELVRMIPGRLVARTVDAEGKVGFVLTLQTREQHIRREKATSNICTNQALCATTATVYLSLLGNKGLRQVALLAMEKTHEAAGRICELNGFSLYFPHGYVREVAIKTPIPAHDLIERLIDYHAILPGIDLGRYFKGMEHGLLLTVTEKRSNEDIDRLLAALKSL